MRVAGNQAGAGGMAGSMFSSGRYAATSHQPPVPPRLTRAALRARQFANRYAIHE